MEVYINVHVICAPHALRGRESRWVCVTKEYFGVVTPWDVHMPSHLGPKHEITRADAASNFRKIVRKNVLRSINEERLKKKAASMEQIRHSGWFHAEVEKEAMGIKHQLSEEVR
mgnify:CR=1 FL=1